MTWESKIDLGKKNLNLQGTWEIEKSPWVFERGLPGLEFPDGVGFYRLCYTGGAVVDLAESNKAFLARPLSFLFEINRKSFRCV